MERQKRQEVQRRLWRYQDAKERLQMAREALEEVETRLTGISIDYSKEKVQSSMESGDRIGELIDRLSEMRKGYIEAAHEYLDTMQEVRRMIDSVDDARLHALLFRRYILYQRWEKIAYEMGYDFRHVMRLHIKALEQIGGEQIV